MKPLRYLASLAFVFALLAAVSVPAQAASPSWSLSPSQFDFGTKAPHTGESAPAHFTLTNTGDVELEAASVGIEASPGPGPEREWDLFRVKTHNCYLLTPGAECSVEVTFNPLAPGQKSGRLVVSGPSDATPAYANLSGIASGPVVSISPGDIRMGGLLVGEGPGVTKVVALTNTGTEALRISRVALVPPSERPLLDFGYANNADQFRISGGSCGPGVAVAPGQRCTVWIDFYPTTLGALAAQLRISDDATPADQYVLITGDGTTSYRPPPLRAKLGRHPPHRTTKRSATFSWALKSLPSSGFICRLDHDLYKPCASPVTYRRLPLGRHLFHVLPTERPPLGTERVVATYRFEVVPKKTGSRK